MHLRPLHLPLPSDGVANAPRPSILAADGRNESTREQNLAALRLYRLLPFGRFHSRNPEVIALASRIDRTPSAVAMRLSNFASLDPMLRERGVRGLAGISEDARRLWHEFEAAPEDVLFEAEQVVAGFEGRPVEPEAGSQSGTVDGREREATVKVRVNQRLFRLMVLNGYGATCCVTGIDEPSLLVGSHIVPWAEDVSQRLNPRNGLCLNALHDRAFEVGLMAVSDDFRVQVAPHALRTPSLARWLGECDGQPLVFGGHLRPDPLLLAVIVPGSSREGRRPSTATRRGPRHRRGPLVCVSGALDGARGG